MCVTFENSPLELTDLGFIPTDNLTLLGTPAPYARFIPEQDVKINTFF